MKTKLEIANIKSEIVNKLREKKDLIYEDGEGPGYINMAGFTERVIINDEATDFVICLKCSVPRCILSANRLNGKQNLRRHVSTYHPDNKRKHDDIENHFINKRKKNTRDSEYF